MHILWSNGRPGGISKTWLRFARNTRNWWRNWVCSWTVAPMDCPTCCSVLPLSHTVTFLLTSTAGNLQRFLQRWSSVYLWLYLRKDKYSAKRDKYHVDVKDMESKKESNTEIEEHTGRSEASLQHVETSCVPVCFLFESWFHKCPNVCRSQLALLCLAIGRCQPRKCPPMSQRKMWKIFPLMTLFLEAQVYLCICLQLTDLLLILNILLFHTFKLQSFNSFGIRTCDMLRPSNRSKPL